MIYHCIICRFVELNWRCHLLCCSNSTRYLQMTKKVFFESQWKAGAAQALCTHLTSTLISVMKTELSRKMVQELSLMTFHWNILKGPQLTFRKNWFARHSKYHSIPRPRKAVPVVHHLHLNSDKRETCFIIGFHGTDNSLTPGVMAISRIISPFDIILR